MACSRYYYYRLLLLPLVVMLMVGGGCYDIPYKAACQRVGDQRVGCDTQLGWHRFHRSVESMICYISVSYSGQTYMSLSTNNAQDDV